MLETNKIYQGDCIEELKKLPDNSVDAIITDPPYGLEFMGKEWDKLWDKRNKDEQENDGVKTFLRAGKNLSQYKAGFEAQQFHFDWAKECLRVLKPGGFLLSFGGTRTYHRMTCGIEDAGFEIRDCIMWVYGSGFPKSLNIGKAIDKMMGAEREVVGERADFVARRPKNNFEQFTSINKSEKGINSKKFAENMGIITAPATDEAKQWNGWGTALKPAVEPIVVARKPLSEKNVALNVLKWGTGGINIDGCRVEYTDGTTEEQIRRKYTGSNEGNGSVTNNFGVKDIKMTSESTLTGRFPANLILDEESAKMLDKQTGNIGCSSDREKYKGRNYGESMFLGDKPLFNSPTYTDKGGASRFFYVAKASKSERNFGLENTDIPEKPIPINEPHNSKNLEERYNMTSKNNHPTVKPIKLMEYLIKLVSKENAVILDPFLGSGTTAIACLKTNRKFIGIEKESDYVKIAEARIKPYLSQQKLI